jgi:DNA-3-methyladenine glycosylase
MSEEFSFLEGRAEDVAPRLLGCEILRTIGGKRLRVRIVETEAYSQEDTASHSYKGRTPRTDVMFGPAGHLYVYFTYGMHYCCNIVVGEVGTGAAVLIRAVEPLEELEVMSQNRQGRSGIELTNGPAKLCQALAIDKSLNGYNLRTGEIRLVVADPLPPAQIVQATRIGISRAVDVPWRFYEAGNKFVSKFAQEGLD